jgi:hypothetical protein
MCISADGWVAILNDNFERAMPIGGSEMLELLLYPSYDVLRQVIFFKHVSVPTDSKASSRISQ